MAGRVSKLFAVGLTVISIAGCFSERAGNATGDSSGKEPLKIVATTGMVADVVRHVVGAHGEVTALMGAGVDPHLFKANSHDIKRLQRAEVVFYSGLMLEGRMQEALVQVNRKNRPVVAVTELLEKEDQSYLRSPPQFEGHYDPHVWMDVAAWSRCIDVVVKTLIAVDAKHADDYRKNATSYQAELTELDEYVKRIIGSIPASQRVLVTAHDAFGYFGRRYGMDVYSVQGVTTESEAGIHDINRLVDFLVDRKLPAIFVESSVNEKNIRAVIEGAASRNVTVHIGAQLFSDAMGQEGSYEGTYIGMIDHNATFIARSLGGEAPEKGFRNQLAANEKQSIGFGALDRRIPVVLVIVACCSILVALLSQRQNQGRHQSDPSTCALPISA